MNRVVLSVLFYAIAVQVVAHAQSPVDNLQVVFPGKTWSVVINSPGFVAKVNGMQKDGRQYLMATNDKTGMNLSVSLERSSHTADANSCSGFLRKRVESLSGLGLQDVKYLTVGGMAAAEYLVPEAQGYKLRQNHLVACTAKEDVYVDVHLSKTHFKPEEEPLFTLLMNSVTIADNASATAAASKSSNTRDTSSADLGFKLSLPDHEGQLRWSAPGFKIVESSVKPNGNEIGIRGTEESKRLTFLGFLFLFPEQAPMTSTKCRDGVMEPAKKENPQLKILSTLERPATAGPPISLVRYVAERKGSKSLYSVRGFVASADLCGDLEVYSETPINADDTELKALFDSYVLETNYAPRFVDAFLYAQLLYKKQMYKAAAPIFETALAKLRGSTSPDATTLRRIATDQAGMAYGMSGNLDRARAIFKQAIEQDPDYPMYYYNLACADVEEKKLADAQVHLQQAFARKANVLSGERMPDPTKDDSFLPYKNNKEFWSFLRSLQSN
ncbi:MAG: tetratricopeptide repeat protein [Terriglobales bacterium]